MKFFLIKPFLGSVVFLFLILSGVLETEISYGIDSIYQTSYRTSPEIISETVPIRVGETAISYDFPYEPQIIKRQIISTRIISPPANSEIKTINDKPLLPLRQMERTERKENIVEKIEKKENQVLPEETNPVLNNWDEIKSSEISVLDSKTSIEPIERTSEKPIEKPIEEPTGEPVGKPTGEPAGKPTGELVGKPTGELAGESIGEFAGESTGEKPFLGITFPLLTEEPDRITTLKPAQPLQNEPNNTPKPTPPVSQTVLGQSSSFASDLEKALDEPLPSPKGLVDVSVIDPKLFESAAEHENKKTPEQNTASTPTTENNSTVISKEPSEENKLKNEKQVNGINGILLLVTIVSVTMLIYAVVIAFDYHQRWIQSLTTQNNRFAGISDSGFSGNEMDMDADFSGNIPLYNGNSNIPAGLSHFRSESQYY
ncbi:MAG: PT domain-containing protein [Planctomycetaceae bacterium]|jgi:hypothetical protein|nr:PT domain-containing protein [Planctomycetaceae bacterium]